MKNPIQPLYKDESGVVRFKENAIVRYILDKGGVDLNELAVLDFNQDDREQFAQLIGYSHSGSGDLSYMSDATFDISDKMYESGMTEQEAKIEYYEDLVRSLRLSVKEMATNLFNIHEDDLAL